MYRELPIEPIKDDVHCPGTQVLARNQIGTFLRNCSNTIREVIKKKMEKNGQAQLGFNSLR